MLTGLTPKQIVEELDRYIIGQNEGKRAVAIAIRNRARRQALPEDLQEEIYPKNIMMIGPTGVGKTEIARRLSRLVDAPFIKVEASKFTEVGYIGRDVDSIMRDLAEIAVSHVRTQRTEECMSQAEKEAEERILDCLIPPHPPSPPPVEDQNVIIPEPPPGPSTREQLREKLRKGLLESRMVEPELEESPVGLQLHAIGLPASLASA